MCGYHSAYVHYYYYYYLLPVHVYAYKITIYGLCLYYHHTATALI